VSAVPDLRAALVDLLGAVEREWPRLRDQRHPQHEPAPNAGRRLRVAAEQARRILEAEPAASLVELSPASVDAVAARLAGLVAQAPAAQLVDAAEIAQRFGLKRSYVYDHADELGAIRLGDGPRGRLRFDPAKVADRLSACSDSRESEQAASRTGKPSPPRRRRRATGAERKLLPITPPGAPR
jgi:AraC-like DNA-binding protein